ncbi:MULTISPECIES: hypothetical protein [Cyanophyceae]|uniref:hypothetical protein n=1 Tax=Cyanophyceae TaxID=3028117 RepID=UPI001683B0A7|nr:hypothetical protein [Trichocoleus sp. FACHB-40]MBD2001914.1 hypothetical protein [Trichocoleus sp. FACHB-40]
MMQDSIESALSVETILIPGNGVDLEREFQKVYEINTALSMFLGGEMDLETYLDICEFWEQNMDLYLATADANLEILGF